MFRILDENFETVDFGSFVSFAFNETNFVFILVETWA